MKTIQDIVAQITNLTLDIETNYPELYILLLEDPITIPSKQHTEISMLVLEDYAESLQELIKQYHKTHKKGSWHL